MTIEEARALIPPGWVECDYRKPGDVADYWKMAGYVSNGRYWEIYAIPAPKPEPRRVPMGNALVWLDNCGRPAISSYWSGSAGAEYANTKWKLDPDAREWVEVIE